MTPERIRACLEKTVGDVTGNLVNNDFQSWLGRKDSAQQQLFNAGSRAKPTSGTPTRAHRRRQTPICSSVR
jgi:hypothetical protein